MNLLCIQHFLKHNFTKVGSTIGKHPYYFLFGTLIITSIFSIGIFRIKSIRDFNILITAKNGRAQNNKNLLEKIFPMNTTSFADMVRLSETMSAMLVQITAIDGGSVFREKIIEEIINLDKTIRNKTIQWKNKILNYENLCGKRNGKCLENSFYKIIPFAKEILAGKYIIKYPVDINNISFVYEEYLTSLGGVKLHSNGYLKDAKAARLIYMLDVSDSSKSEALKIWKETINDYLNYVWFNTIDVSFFNDMCALKELENVGKLLMNRLPIAIASVMIFSFLSCFTNNWLRSKPWLGPSACISAMLAIISGFGLAGFIGIGYNDVHIGLSVIIMGTEIDDAFVMISAWRNSSVNDNVETRMKKVYSEAGVSITVTSLTNLVSFCIGTTSAIPIVQIFCAYAACCIIFTYIYEIIFFGACLALSGYREEKKLHPLTFRPINDQKQKEDSNQINTTNKQEEFLMAIFRDTIGNLLTFFQTKIIVILLIFINISFGIYGFIHIKKGNEFSDLLFKDSPINHYNTINFKYFSEYYYPLHIFIDRPLNYADQEVQNSLEKMLTTFESHPHISGNDLRISWLKYYKLFADMPVGKFSLKGYNMSDKQDFIDGLRNVFLRFPQAREFKEDIIFNENFTEIIASRFMLILTDISNQDIEFSLLKDLYQIADKSAIPVKLHTVSFHLSEQAIIIENMVYEIILISSALVCIVFFLLIPNMICALSISATVLCIICETVGYVSFLNVKMDLVLLYSLVLCVGFSINYPTHISFSFVVAKNLPSEERIKTSIYEIGFPIIQGLSTTILAILFSAFEPVYVATSFFKIMSVLALETAFHAMFAIPVILSLLLYCDKNQNESDNFISITGIEEQSINHEKENDELKSML